VDIFNTKSMLAVGLSSAMSVGAAHAGVDESAVTVDSVESSIVAISGPNVRITVYDGIATIVGIAESVEEASNIESEIAAVEGVDHVINLIAWQDSSPAE